MQTRACQDGFREIVMEHQPTSQSAPRAAEIVRAHALERISLLAIESHAAIITAWPGKLALFLASCSSA